MNALTTPTIRDFGEWLVQSQRGEKYLYHIGELALQREWDKKLDNRASAVNEARERGLVYCVQQRIEPHMFYYLALRTGKGTIR